MRNENLKGNNYLISDKNPGVYTLYNKKRSHSQQVRFHFACT